VPAFAVADADADADDDAPPPVDVDVPVDVAVPVGVPVEAVTVPAVAVADDVAVVAFIIPAYAKNNTTTKDTPKIANFVIVFISILLLIIDGLEPLCTRSILSTTLQPYLIFVN